MPTKPTIWKLIKDRWELLVLIATVLLGVGFLKGDYASVKADVSEVKGMNISVLKSKVEAMGQMQTDITVIKVEQARLSQDVKWMREQMERRVVSIAPTTQPGDEQGNND